MWRFSIAVMIKGFYNKNMKRNASLTVWRTLSVTCLLVAPSLLFAASMGAGGGAPLGTGPGGTVISDYRLFPLLSCDTGTQPLTCFTQAVFKFSQIAIIILAVAAIVIAGIVYMTSAGNPKQIEMSKKLILGALTGVAVLILGRLFLTQVVGVAWPW